MAIRPPAPFSPRVPSPIVPDRDRDIASTIRKYTRPDPLFAGEWARATPSARAALERSDAMRLERGQRPYTQPQSAVGLRAASTGETTVGEPNQSMLGDAIRNAREFVGGLPRLPQALVKEALAIPTIGQKLPEALDRSSNPIEAIGNVADIPGARMIPGSFIASQFGTEGKGVKGLTDDPLFTVLDVAPYVGKATRAVPSVRAASKLVDNAGTADRVGRYSTALRYTSRPRTSPIDPRATSQRGRLLRENLEPTRIGHALEGAGGQFRGTRLGQLADQTWGATAMDTVQRQAVAERRVNVESYATDAIAKELLPYRRATGEARAAALEAGVTPERLAAINDAIKLGEVSDLALSGPEAAYVKAARGFRERLDALKVREGLMEEVQITLPSGAKVKELLPPKQARKYLKAERELTRAQFVTDLHKRLTAPFDPAVTRTAADFLSIADSPLSTKRKMTAARALIARMEAEGYKVDTFAKNIPTTKSGRLQLPNNASHLDKTLRAMSVERQFTPPTIKALRQELNTLARTDRAIAELMGHLKSKSWKEANTVARNLSRRKRQVFGYDFSDLPAIFRAQNRAAKTLQNFESSFNPDAALTAATKTFQSTRAAVRPTRWQDVVANRATRELQDRLPDLQATGKITPEESARVAELLSDGMLDARTLPENVAAEWKTIKREVRDVWMQLADQGLDPQWVHRVKSQRAGKPVKVTGTIPSLSQLKDRAFDFGSTVNDVMVSIDHEVMELLARRGYEDFVTSIADMMGRNFDDIAEAYAGFARNAASKNPTISYSNHLENLIKRDYAELKVPARTLDDGTVTPSRTVFVPKAVRGVMEKLEPQDLGIIGRAMNPVMTVFRTALLPLSPRWHFHNIFGNAIMATAEHGLGVWRHVPEGKRIAAGIRGQIDAEGLPMMQGGKKGRQLRETYQWGRHTDLATKPGRTVALWETQTGTFLRRVWDQSGVGRKAEALIDRSYAMNEMVDDMFRSASYLYGENRALRRGMTAEAAEAAGVQAARRVAQSWDRLTPIERTVIRNVFPFYSWMKHLIGYTSRYPVDHPWRTSIAAAFIRAEVEDYGTGLPQMFFELLDVTGPAKRLGFRPGEGERVMVNLGAANPFQDVGSYATLMGFIASPFTKDQGDVGSLGAVTSQMNPFAQTFMRAIGVDPAEGTGDLYGNVSYDPTTGGLRAKVDFNPLSDTFQSILPQSKLLFDLAGVNRDFQQLYRLNPDAARRRMLSTVGYPAALSPRVFDPEVETIKAEVRRYEDLQRTRASALREGNIEKLSRYERLHPLRDRLRAAEQSGTLDRYRPRTAAELRREIREAQSGGGNSNSPTRRSVLSR